MAERTHFVITCEHGGCEVPARYRHLFRGQRRVLHSHRGFDAGALTFARLLAAELRAPLYCATTTRLLIDLNRSPHHRRVFSEFSVGLDREARSELYRQYYFPYRDRVERHITKRIASGRRVLHISVHSFTPTWLGKVRNAEIGLLYDPGRALEGRCCRLWQRVIEQRLPGQRVRRNYPYRGTADGFTRYLRTRFADGDYAGIELELNQAAIRGRAWPHQRGLLAKTLLSVRDQLDGR